MQSTENNPTKVPMKLQGKVKYVDPQIIRWRQKLRKFRSYKRKIVKIVSQWPLEMQEQWWDSPTPRLNDKTPLEALRTLHISKAKLVLTEARQKAKKHGY